MAKMTYDAALKQVKAEKPADNYMLITIDYNEKIILPYADGLRLMEAMKSAERFEENYNKPSRIGPMQREKFTAAILSGHDYRLHKMAALLEVTYDEVVAMQNPPTNPTETPPP